METLQLIIETMKSAHCIMTVENTITKLPSSQVSGIESGKVFIRYDRYKASADQIVSAIEKAGYSVRIA